MSKLSDRYFVRPRDVFSANTVNIYDAINLVVYAKLPLKSVLKGSELVAGFFERDNYGASTALLGSDQRKEILTKYHEDLAPLQFPVTPSQYESLLERMLEADETAFPFFFHEHHLLLDRQLRLFLFSQAHKELMDDVHQGKVIIQISDSERTQLLASHAWMSPATFKTYLDNHGVTPWWERESNLATHDRLELILLSDTLAQPSNYDGRTYDFECIPSFVFGRMLLKRSSLPRGYARPALDKATHSASAEATEVTNESPIPQSLREWIQAEPPPTEPELVAVKETAIREPDVQIECPVINQEGSSATSIEEAIKAASSVNDEQMLTKAEVASLIRMSKSSVDNLRKTPSFPKPVSYGTNTIRWKKHEVLQWVASRGGQSRH